MEENNKKLPTYDEKCTLKRTKIFKTLWSLFLKSPYGEVTIKYVCMITWLMKSCPSFGHYKNYQVEHYFATIFHCRVIKSRPSTALSLVSRLFRSCSLSPSILNAGRQLVIFEMPQTTKTSKMLIIFNSIMTPFHSNEKS